MRFIGEGLIHMSAPLSDANELYRVIFFHSFKNNIWSKRLEKAENLPPLGPMREPGGENLQNWRPGGETIYPTDKTHDTGTWQA